MASILSVEINSDGWSADVTIDNWGSNTGLVVYDYGYTGTTLGTPKFALTVTSKGFDATGAATTHVRTIHATHTVRKPYPLELELDETDVSGDLVIRVALSDFVYDKDKSGAGNSGTDIAVSVLAGWATDAVASETLAASLTATNNSTKPYPKIVMKRAWFNYEKIQASAYLVEVIPIGHHVLNDRPFACVKYTATDESANSITGTLTTWGKSSRTGVPIEVVVCSGTISLTTLDKHELVTCDLQAYPWIGDTTEVVDTTGQSDLSPTLCGPIKFFNDKASDYPSSIAYVSWSTSEAYTGVAAAIGDHATARANPHNTIWNARQSIVARNLAQYGRADLNGGIIYIMDSAAAEWCWRSSGTLDDIPSWGTVANTDKCELLITRDPLATRSGVIINKLSVRGVGQSQIKTQRYRISDLTLGNTQDGNGLLTGLNDGTDCCVISDCMLNHTQTSSPMSDAHAGLIMINAAENSFSAGLDGLNGTERCILARGNQGTFEAHITDDVALIGNVMITTLNAGNGTDNSLLFMNRIERPGDGVLYTVLNTINMTGHRIIGNCFVNYSNASTNAYGISSEGATGTYRDAVIAHNSFLGGASPPYNTGRINFVYNGDPAQTQLKDGIRWSGNYCRQYNLKTDVYAESDLAVNNWSMAYSVGSTGNVYSGSAVNNSSFAGRNTLGTEDAASVAFENPTDGIAPGGDYTPQASSSLRGRLLEKFISHDIAGIAILDTAGAYQYPVAIPNRRRSSRFAAFPA